MKYFVVIYNGNVKGLFEFADSHDEQSVASYFPGSPVVVDVTSMIYRPGPGWTYDGQDFTPPEPKEPDVSYYDKAKELIAQIDKQALISTNSGKALAAIACLLLDEEMD